MPTRKIPTPNQIRKTPDLFAKHFLQILTKENDLIPFVWNAAQRQFHESRTGHDLILKARQLGFTTYVQGEMFRRAVTSSRTTMSLANDGDTTTKIRMIADRFWENCGQYNGADRPLRKYANASMTTYPEFESTVTVATAGAVNKGRGGTYTDFHGSEVAFWSDARAIITGAMQGGNPDVVLESTPNGAAGYFYELCMDALEGKGKSNFTLHFFPWWLDAGYKIPLEAGEKIIYTDEEQVLVDQHKLSPEQIKWRRSKKRELKDQFIQEYPEDPYTCFLTSGNGYFGNILHCFNAPFGAKFQPGHQYGAGLDFGKQEDFTAMPVLDKTTKQQVDLLHINHLEWGEIRQRIKAMYNKWNLKSVTGEENSIGDVNIEELRKLGVKVIPFTTTNDSKQGIMSELYNSLHEEGWQLLDIPEEKHEMNSFISKQNPITHTWTLQASAGSHDDIVMGLGMAYYNAIHGAANVIRAWGA